MQKSLREATRNIQFHSLYLEHLLMVDEISPEQDLVVERLIPVYQDHAIDHLLAAQNNLRPFNANLFSHHLYCLKICSERIGARDLSLRITDLIERQRIGLPVDVVTGFEAIADEFDHVLYELRLIKECSATAT